MKWFFATACLVFLINLNIGNDVIEKELREIKIQNETIKIMIQRSKRA